MEHTTKLLLYAKEKRQGRSTLTKASTPASSLSPPFAAQETEAIEADRERYGIVFTNCGAPGKWRGVGGGRVSTSTVSGMHLYHDKRRVRSDGLNAQPEAPRDKQDRSYASSGAARKTQHLFTQKRYEYRSRNVGNTAAVRIHSRACYCTTVRVVNSGVLGRKYDSLSIPCIPIIIRKSSSCMNNIKICRIMIA